MSRVALALILGTSLSYATPSDACSRFLARVAEDIVTLPRDGAVAVPRNAHVLVVPPAATPVPPPSAAAIALFTDGSEAEGNPVPATATHIALTGEFGLIDTIVRLAPVAALEADTTYVVVVDGEPLARFTTGTDVDALPPVAPEVGAPLITPERMDRTGFSCAFDGSAEIPVELGDDAALVVVHGAEGAGLEANPLFDLSSEGALQVFGAGARTVRVVALDLAGNASPPVDVDIDVPADDGLLPVGCTESPPAVWGELALAALVLARRRPRST